MNPSQQLTPSELLNQFLSNDCRLQTLNFLRKNFTGLREEDYEDIYQDASCSLWENMVSGKYVNDGKATLKTYFMSIVKNTAHNVLRKQGTVAIDDYLKIQRNDDETDYVDMDRVDSLINLCNEIDHVSEHDRARIEYLVHQIINDLGKCKELLWGHYCDQLPWSDLAGMCNLATADVAKTTGNRCRNKFKEKYNEKIAKIL